MAYHNWRLSFDDASSDEETTLSQNVVMCIKSFIQPMESLSCNRYHTRQMSKHVISDSRKVIYTKKNNQISQPAKAINVVIMKI